VPSLVPKLDSTYRPAPPVWPGLATPRQRGSQLRATSEARSERLERAVSSFHGALKLRAGNS